MAKKVKEKQVEDNSETKTKKTKKQVLDNPTVLINTAEIDEPKKRGRKKKTEKAEELKVPKQDEKVIEKVQDPENKEPKKRGRKKKTEIAEEIKVPKQDEKIIEKVQLPENIEQKKRGRKKNTEKSLPEVKEEAKKPEVADKKVKESDHKKENISKELKAKSETELPSVRYSDEELEEFAEIIQKEKENALDELRMLKERLEDLTSPETAEESMIYSMHMGEQGSEAQEKEKTFAQIQRIHEYIKKLEDAMERIRNKTYGICRVCGCLIAKERLRAVPITTLSASYKIHQKCPEDGIDRIEPVKK